MVFPTSSMPAQLGPSFSQDPQGLVQGARTGASASQDWTHTQTILLTRSGSWLLAPAWGFPLGQSSPCCLRPGRWLVGSGLLPELLAGSVRGSVQERLGAICCTGGKCGFYRPLLLACFKVSQGLWGKLPQKPWNEGGALGLIPSLS